ncbi:NmrA family NAD(P)-binding protein [Rhizosaccharibacter radicis]|uniref:NAD(P)H-binding protein n=1 Tax=Rhizosaccharibacter radicis TaxID=2782605 RepID=A0ABT1W1F4_9PROT|nr:NAD(P)H-binding protein [Acetobacteraceae bacterium KSS12]
MFVVTGATGKVGGGVARILREAGHPVRVVLRDENKAGAWREGGCEIAVVPDAADPAALTSAMAGAAGVFLMNPPDYDPAPGFPETRARAAAARDALVAARPGRTVFLSTIGARVERFNLLNNGGIFETELSAMGLPVAMLRAAWFMENIAWDIPSARDGRLASFLQPLDRAIDMVATRDIASVAASLLTGGEWTGSRVVELRGPEPVSPQRIAERLGAMLGRPVTAEALPAAGWEARLRAEGMRHPQARIEMLKGFNEGWIAFENGAAERRTGFTALDAVLADLLRREEGAAA